MNSIAGFIITIISTIVLCVQSIAQSPKQIKELPLPEVPATLTKPAERADFIIYHFWDGLDFSNPGSSLDDASLEQNFVNYINLFSHSHSEKLPESVSKLLRSAETNPPVARSLYLLADKYLATKDSPFRNESNYILFLNNAIKSDALGEAGRERAKYRLEAAMKNRPGFKASDFKFETREGEISSLSEIPDAQKTLLIFYDPDCNHCSETIEEIKGLSLDSFKVVAIDPQEDKDLWYETSNVLPQNWIVGFALDPIQDDETYIFEEMPTLYVLDASKNVLLKNATLLEIKELLH